MAAPAMAGSDADVRSARPFTSRASTVILAISLAWALLILTIYFEQLWTLIRTGPPASELRDLTGTLAKVELPYLRQAVARAVSGTLAAALVVAAMFGAGAAADRWLMPGCLETRERIVVRLANGAGILSILLLLTALAGWYRPAVVTGIVAALALLAVVSLARAPWNRIAADAASAFRRALAPPVLPWAVATILAVSLAFVAALAPETEYDALWYHLELPRRWLAAGALTDNVHEYVSLYPGAWELLFGAALALDGSVAARLLHWSTLGASAVVCASIGRRAFSPPAGWIAAAVFVTAPTVFWESTTAYVDLALALHSGVAVGALLLSTKEPDRRLLVLAGVQFGLACATKHLGLVIAAVAVGLFAVAKLKSDTPARVARTVVFLGLLTSAIPSPWYVRAWIASGNPVFPELYDTFGARPAERWNDVSEEKLDRFKAHFGRPRTPATLAALPWDMTMHSWRYGGTLGPFLLMLLPGVAAVAWRQRAARWLLAGAAAYLIVWASPVSSFQLRFLVPWWLFVSALVAAGAAFVTRASGTISQPGAMLINAVLAMFSILNLPPFTALHEREREGWQRWLTHAVHRVPINVVSGAISEDAYLSRQIRSYPAWRFINEHAPADARVLTFFGGDHYYSNRSRLWSDAPQARQVTWDAGSLVSSELLERLERLHITYILAPVRPPDRNAEHDGLALLQPDFLSRFPVIFEDFWTIVYRVDARGIERHTPVSGEIVRTPGSSDHR